MGGHLSEQARSSFLQQQQQQDLGLRLLLLLQLVRLARPGMQQVTMQRHWQQQQQRVVVSRLAGQRVSAAAALGLIRPQ